ncbi:MAG: 2-succinyl-5-enolpyruvyl-6-hydroxy-3-cyclohexene-1-carboxylic-acid synthase [Armatimonadota bacterium]|nr:2-succinyl-5-enolpyruvyl-6-hydroxy-3-cyclohexene-1-carboxylic-acid synthase [Armatimonadota bacterium]MDR7469020.1 2-succinyl-5-enolpyruvyl-6-hydroxy-3-cyclohexene-1-carboxylic-acid synthase [Armatimonadota bacterium]MDR7475550.1 2-succinyl-5-enolpyruvyl-6-hydroxy-3-cyclohexene-1-carboxylic-acid synthase [Armatimonadota bacterium]MDR7538061.1 2-succinyl-5-enolpyruvyl-6-hydroxy-3-cyclohexene-1-carboxylic-acid synthase [Armatimonadota bacterium]
MAAAEPGRAPLAPENATYAFVGALVDELVRAGVRHFCLCPGSRSTPLAMTAVRQGGLKVWMHVDERAAAYFALGLAKALRSPVAVVSTSGTAAANFLPAVIEARFGRVPLLVLTADRPHELRDAGANQTIDQLRLFGVQVKWFAEVAPPLATEAMLRYARQLAAQATFHAVEAPAGPVHLNFPFREPLVPVPAPNELPPTDDRAGPAWEGRAEGQPYTVALHAVRAPDAAVARALAGIVGAARRGLIVCGPQDDPAFPQALTRLADVVRFPVLADPLSGVRCGPHDRSLVVDAYDLVLRADRAAATLEPDLVLRFGAMPASRPLLQYLQRHSRARQVVADGARWSDPLRVAAQILAADPRLVCEALTAALAGHRPAPAQEEWTDRWLELSCSARAAAARRLLEITEPFEGRVFAELGALLPDGALLVVGNSMPVRDLDTFLPSVPTRLRVLGNRGASGIDGLLSTALGAAAAAAGPVVAVLGDLAFYHDMNGLLAARLHGLAATIVLLNNNGGGIFNFMPQAAYPAYFEALFGVPHGLEFRHAADLYGATYAVFEGWSAFGQQVRAGLARSGLTIVEIQTDRGRNVRLHQEIWASAAEALGAGLSTR